MEELVVIALCLVLNAFFAAYEMAFVSVPKPELRRLARNGNKEAQRLLHLRENPERTLSTIQIGITLVGAISAAVGGAGATESISPWFRLRFDMSEHGAEFLAIVLVVLPLTYLSVVVGELVPKSLALKNPLKITLLGARWLWAADRVLAPAVNLLEWSTKLLLRTFFPRAKTMVPVSEATVEIEALPPSLQDAVLNLAHLENRKVRDILLRWKDVNSIKTSDTMEEIVTLILASGHTRLPVCNESGAAVGILHTKEYLAYREAGNSDWHSMVRPILVVQPSDSLLTVLRLMQKNHRHMAIVGREAPIGIVTLEDISEEIWGDFYDEDDTSRIRKVFADRVKTKRVPPPL